MRGNAPIPAVKPAPNQGRSNSGKIKLAILLPIVQVLLTVVLTNWGEAIQLRRSNPTAVGLIELTRRKRKVSLPGAQWAGPCLSLRRNTYLANKRDITRISFSPRYGPVFIRCGAPLVLCRATNRSVRVRHSPISLANPGTWIPVLPTCDPVGTETFLLGERALLHVRFAKLSQSCGHDEWCHLYHLVHGSKLSLGLERLSLPRGPMPGVRLEAQGWGWVWVRPDDWPIEALERNWGAHYHLGC